MRWTTNVIGSNSQQQVLAAPAHLDAAGGRRPSSGAGTAVFNAVKLNGVNFVERAAGESLGQSLGVRLDLGHLGHAQASSPAHS